MNKFKVGDKVRLTEESLSYLSLPDVEYTIIDILDERLIFPIVISLESVGRGKDSKEFFSQDEIELSLSMGK